MVRKRSNVGWFYLTLFGVFVLLGIGVKRWYGHPELVPVFHLPAAVFLVLAGYDLTHNLRIRNQQRMELWRRERQGP